MGYLEAALEHGRRDREGRHCDELVETAVLVDRWLLHLEQLNLARADTLAAAAKAGRERPRLPEASEQLRGDLERLARHFGVEEPRAPSGDPTRVLDVVFALQERLFKVIHDQRPAPEEVADEAAP